MIKNTTVKGTRLMLTKELDKAHDQIKNLLQANAVQAQQIKILLAEIQQKDADFTKLLADRNEHARICVERLQEISDLIAALVWARRPWFVRGVLALINKKPV